MRNLEGLRFRKLSTLDVWACMTSVEGAACKATRTTSELTYACFASKCAAPAVSVTFSSLIQERLCATTAVKRFYRSRFFVLSR